MDHTQRDRVGPRSLQLTKLGYGGAPIGNFSTSVTDADAHCAMQAAWQAGIRYFDTAPWYGLGLSEHRIGRFLRDKSKAEYVLSTKVGRLLRPWPPRYGPRLQRGPWVEPLSFEVRFDYSYDGIIRSYEDSLQRLGLPEVDILLIHDLDRNHHSPEGNYQARLGQLSNGGFAALRDLRDLREDQRHRRRGQHRRRHHRLAGPLRPGPVPRGRPLHAGQPGDLANRTGPLPPSRYPHRHRRGIPLRAARNGNPQSRSQLCCER